ncbi:YjhX family toxin [Rhodobium gokarnense]|uniref:UPF0386 protein M2319_003795 n=1 Tax=Rhodobium gokarnense TaxID=364296 RepID=A0ABT3HGB5_9HYPH|nr:YjhX family toxin [Rhodobium gokarnense]MCW2309441.1 uncharacterized protein YjhX (UPF0386 family) [Rhodobium gokarnense]
MNISRTEQRILHALAQGGRIRVIRDDNDKKIVDVDCLNRDGWRLADCKLDTFRRLKKRRLILSKGGKPYEISPLGIRTVRAQLDNR